MVTKQVYISPLEAVQNEQTLVKASSYIPCKLEIDENIKILTQ